MDKIKKQISMLIELRRCWHGNDEAQKEIDIVLTRLYDILYS